MDHRCIYSFQTVNQALSFEKSLKDRSIYVRLMPVPRELSSSCGTCASVNCLDLEEIGRAIEEDRLIYDTFYKLENKPKKKWFQA